MKIGFIGQGFIGKHMADDFVDRGFEVVRYALEDEYVNNKSDIKNCEVVFIAVPTPTTPKGFDDSILQSALTLVGRGKVAVIKSTILPGKTREFSKSFPHLTVMHSPEFLTEKNVQHDTKKPKRNIIGVPEMTSSYMKTAKKILAILPSAPYEKICLAEEAELIKYGGNIFLAMKVIFMNTIYEIANNLETDYEVVAEAMGADDRIGYSHMKIIDSSGHDKTSLGRGAGGHCFPKDLSALRKYCESCDLDKSTIEILKVIEKKNIKLLCDSKKDLDLLMEIYGCDVCKRKD